MTEVGSVVATIFFLAGGLMMLCHAARGDTPRRHHDVCDPNDRGKAMDRHGQVLFFVAGLLFCCVGVFLYFRFSN